MTARNARAPCLRRGSTARIAAGSRTTPCASPRAWGSGRRRRPPAMPRRRAPARRGESSSALFRREALADQLGGELVQAHALLLRGGVQVAHQVAVQLHGERHQAHLAIALALLALVEHLRRALAVAVVGGAAAGEDPAALQLF